MNSKLGEDRGFGVEYLKLKKLIFIRETRQVPLATDQLRCRWLVQPAWGYKRMVGWWL